MEFKIYDEKKWNWRKKIRYLWTQERAIFINTYDLDATVSHALFT